MKKRSLIFLFVCFYCITYAQQTNKFYQNWYFYLGNYKVNKNIAFHLDAQLRVLDGFQLAQQYLFRPGIQYIFNKKSNLTLGYAYIGTHSASLDVIVPEHRFWEQYIYRIIKPKMDMTNRFRLEQRNIAILTAFQNGIQNVGWRKGNRVRYFNRTLVPLPVKADKKLKPYLAFQEEIFINFKNKDINPNTFDQNRLYFGIGLHKNNMRYELGYMNQFINNAAGSDRVNHALHIALFQNMDFSK
jgi:Protein of unknown function (DUF2490)